MSADSQAPAEFDAFAGDYDAALQQGLKFTGEGKEYFAQGRVHLVKQRLTQKGFTPVSCLDFGCGTGTSANLLTEELSLQQYAGYDPSSESIAVARQNHPTGERFRFVHDLSELENNRFDLAFCNGVFHHIPPTERAEACRNIYARLKSGGWFAFWENNKWNPVVHFLMSRVPFDRDAQMLFPHDARRLLTNAGFEIVRTDSWFVFPASLKMLRPLEPWLCGLPLGGQYLVLARKP